MVQSIAGVIGARPNCCYRNAILAMFLLPEVADWRYVEGWVISSEWPIEHAWLQTPEGQIVDPTLALFGQRYRLARYFVGPPFNRNDHMVYRSRWVCPDYEVAKTWAYADRASRGEAVEVVFERCVERISMGLTACAQVVATCLCWPVRGPVCDGRKFYV